MVQPVVSIIIPVYNAQATLQACVDSFLSIDTLPLEIILVNDGSTDDSPIICDQYASHHENVFVYHQENAGVSAARNKGISESRGEFLYFMDSDDLPNASVLCQGIKIIQDNQYDMVAAGYEFTDMDLNVLRRQINTAQTGAFPPETACISFLRDTIKIGIGSFLVRKSSVEYIRFPLDIKYGEDTNYICKCIVESKSIYVMDEVMRYYRQNPRSAIHKLDLSRFDNYYARSNFQSFVEKNHPEMSRLISFIAHYHIPEVLYDDIRLMCLKGSSYRALKAYLKRSRLDEKIAQIIQNQETEQVFLRGLVDWNANPRRFFVHERRKHYQYLIRSSLGRIKRRILGCR